MVETNQDWRVLWLKVIKLAQEEAEGRHAYWDDEPEKIRRAAVKWLTKPSRGLCLVCEMAGFSPDMTWRLIEDSRRKYVDY